MFTNPQCLLTAKDYSILEAMLERRASQDLLRQILQSKLSTAHVVFREDIPADIVTLNSRVRYRVNGAPAETRLICQDEIRGTVGSVLPVTQPRGLALLGLAEGETYRLPGSALEEVAVHVLEVLYQPEAAMRESARLSGQRVAPRLRLVHSVDDLVRPAFPASARVRREHDDPGPSAA